MFRANSLYGFLKDDIYRSVFRAQHPIIDAVSATVARSRPGIRPLAGRTIFAPLLSAGCLRRLYILPRKCRESAVRRWQSFAIGHASRRAMVTL